MASPRAHSALPRAGLRRSPPEARRAGRAPSLTASPRLPRPGPDSAARGSGTAARPVGRVPAARASARGPAHSPSPRVHLRPPRRRLAHRPPPPRTRTLGAVAAASRGRPGCVGDHKLGSETAVGGARGPGRRRPRARGGSTAKSGRRRPLRAQLVGRKGRRRKKYPSLTAVMRRDK